MGDKVVIRDKDNKKWDRLGEVTDDHQGEDGKVRSFTISLEDGSKVVRSARFMHKQPFKTL